MTFKSLDRRRFLRTGAIGASVGAIGARQLIGAEPTDTKLSPGITPPVKAPDRTAIEFLDPRTIEHTYFLDRVITTVQKHAMNPLLEDCMPKTILSKEGGGFRLWYASRKWFPGHRTEHDLRYAESSDGVTWSVPELGLRERDGSRDNNVLLTANDEDAQSRQLTGAGGIEGWHVVDGEQAPMPGARGRFTAMYLTGLKKAGGVCLAHSDDGLRWTAYPENPVFRTWSDTANNFFFDRRLGRYVFYHRPMPQMHAGIPHANRVVARVESDDLVRWDNARIVLDTDARDAPAFSKHKNARGRDKQWYGMLVTPYQDFYLGIAWYLNEMTGDFDTRLLHSFDGVDWRREPAEVPFIAPAEYGHWDSGFLAGRLPVSLGDQLLCFYGGCNMNHSYKMMNDRKSDDYGLGLATVPKGRLIGYRASPEAEDKGGLLTRPFLLTNPGLTINADAAGGEVRTALTSEDGTAISGRSTTEAVPIQADGLTLPLRWKNGSDLSDLAGRRVRLRISVRNATLFGLGFSG